MDASERRLRVLSGQLAPVAEVELSSISRASTSASASSSTYASATGQPSSYARVHGEPSRAPAVWREIRSVAREELQDVKYHKAVGEGIAKVDTWHAWGFSSGSVRAVAICIDWSTAAASAADHNQSAREAERFQAPDRCVVSDPLSPQRVHIPSTCCPHASTTRLLSNGAFVRLTMHAWLHANRCHACCTARSCNLACMHWFPAIPWVFAHCPGGSAMQ